jgi:Uma2 family endonuclease
MRYVFYFLIKLYLFLSLKKKKKKIVLQLTDEQAWFFQGAPFTPTFLVEVADVGKDTDNSKFREADKRFKEELITQSTVVQLGWLINPQHKRIYIYRRGRRCNNPRWGDISGENVLPGFVLDMSLIDRIIDPVRYSLFLYSLL